ALPPDRSPTTTPDVSVSGLTVPSITGSGRCPDRWVVGDANEPTHAGHHRSHGHRRSDAGYRRGRGQSPRCAGCHQAEAEVLMQTPAAALEASLEPTHHQAQGRKDQAAAASK